MPPVDQPDWLVPLLDDGVVRGHDAFARVRHAYPVGERAEPPPTSPSDAPDVQYIAAVDEFDVNLVKDFYALTPAGRTDDGAMWWVRAASGWAREVGDPLLPADQRLVAISRSLSEDVERQLDRFFASGRGDGRPDREALRLRLLRALRREGVGSIDTPWGYLQWTGHERGLRLEAADGQDAELPLQDELMSQLRWLGWRAPNGESRNAWLDLIGDDAVDAALDLITRTLRQVTLLPPLPGPLRRGQWPSHPNHDETSSTDPHYFDDGGEPTCALCGGAPSASVHRPPIIQLAPRAHHDKGGRMADLEPVREDARRLAGGAVAPLVVVDLLDAFDGLGTHEVHRIPVQRVDRMVRAVGTDHAADRLLKLADQRIVRLELSVRRQVSGLLEGMPRPFSFDTGGGTRLAALCRELSLRGAQVLVCSMWTSADDPFFGALSHVNGVAWLGDEVHAFERLDSHTCVCGRSRWQDVHSDLAIDLPSHVERPAGSRTTDPGPCARCLVVSEDDDGDLYWVPEEQRVRDTYPYTTECLLCGERHWRSEHASEMVVDVDALLAATDEESVEAFARSIEASYDEVELELHETRTVGPAITCGGSGGGLSYPVDLAEFWNLCEAYEQSQWVNEDFYMDPDADDESDTYVDDYEEGASDAAPSEHRPAQLQVREVDPVAANLTKEESVSTDAAHVPEDDAPSDNRRTRVLVVAATYTYQEYLEHGLYARGPNPQFQKDFTHLAFYVQGEIQRHVAQIERRYDDVLQTAEAIAALDLGEDHAQRIRHRIGRGDSTLRHRVFFLTRPEAPGTLWLPHAIPRREGDFAYTMGTRYAWLEDLVAVSLRRGLTSDLGGS